MTTSFSHLASPPAVTRFPSRALLTSASVHFVVLALVYAAYRFAPPPVPNFSNPFIVAPSWTDPSASLPTASSLDPAEVKLQVPSPVREPSDSVVPTSNLTRSLHSSTSSPSASNPASGRPPISEAQFNRLHPRSPGTFSSSTVVSKIDATEIIRDLRSGVASAPEVHGGASGGDTFQDYFTRLKQRLREEIGVSPDWSDALQVVAELQILPDGRLTAGRIVTPSANRRFDAAVLRAIAQVQLPPPPEGLDRVLRVPVVVREIVR